MPAHKTLPIELSSAHEGELRALVRTNSTSQKLAERARIVPLAATGLGVDETAQRLGVWRKTVSTWRRRWRDAGAATLLVWLAPLSSGHRPQGHYKVAWFPRV
jgi:hypothetical protein